MRRILFEFIIVLLLASLCSLVPKAGFAQDSGVFDPTVVVLVGNNNLDAVPLMQIQRMLEHKGLLYVVVENVDELATSLSGCSLVIVLGSTQPVLGPTEPSALAQAVETGLGLIWIGEGLPESLFEIMGLRIQSEQESSQTMNIDYNGQSTMLFNETMVFAQTEGATVEGFFVDSAETYVSPAEFSYKRSVNGLTYYFAYDVCSYWFADPQTPWLRAYRLNLAIENVLSDHVTVRLAPYPNNLQTAFIIRVEDVDPLHTDPEWLNRANNFLEYCVDNNAPLSIGLTPTYIDPEIGLNVSLDAPTAKDLRTWLSKNLLVGGTIIQHGYTHQIGEEKTGMAPEFYNPGTGEWLPLHEQEERIQRGRNQIVQALGFTPRGFEAPHYVANEDTYQALKSLGFDYVSHNTDTAFVDRQGLTGLVNIPETLGYIPLDSSEDIESSIKNNLDALYDIGGVLLVFNHLFDDSALRIGKDLTEYVIAKPNVWKTNTDSMARFWEQRFRAYDMMSVQMGEDLTLTLGPCDRTGLTFTLSNMAAIQSVKINGKAWSTFTENSVILPALPEGSNTIAISFGGQPPNANLSYGLALIAVTTAASFLFTVRAANAGKYKQPKKGST